MQFPRFTIRVLMVAFTVVALVAMAVGEAVADWAWSVLVTTCIAAIIAMASVPAVLLMHALFFAVCSAAAGRFGKQESIARTSRGGVERSATPAALESATSSPPASVPSTPH